MLTHDHNESASNTLNILADTEAELERVKAELEALRSENAALRQRVDDLEQYNEWLSRSKLHLRTGADRVIEQGADLECYEEWQEVIRTQPQPPIQEPQS